MPNAFLVCLDPTSRCICEAEHQNPSVRVSHHVTSRHVTSRHVTSRHVASRRVASRRVASRRVASRRVASRRGWCSNCTDYPKLRGKPEGSRVKWSFISSFIVDFNTTPESQSLIFSARLPGWRALPARMHLSCRCVCVWVSVGICSSVLTLLERRAALST